MDALIEALHDAVYDDDRDAEEAKDKPLSLEEDEGEQEIVEKLERQKDKLEGLLKDMKEVVEQSELAEPLLNRKLYESFRA